MPKRCKHEYVTISKHVEAWSVWDIKDGVITAEASDGPNDTYDVYCYDCGQSHRYGPRSHPKWLRQHIVTIANRQAGGG